MLIRFVRGRVPRTKHLTSCTCGICVPAAHKLCAQQDASFSNGKPAARFPFESVSKTLFDTLGHPAISTIAGFLLSEKASAIISDLKKGEQNAQGSDFCRCPFICGSNARPCTISGRQVLRQIFLLRNGGTQDALTHSRTPPK